MKELHLLSILLFAVSTSLDNFGVGVSYGLRNICVPLSVNVLVAFFNSCGTLISMLSGKGLLRFLNPSTADYIGASLLVGIGSLIIIAEFYKKRAPTPPPAEEPARRRKTFFFRVFAILEDPFAAGVICLDHITLKESFVLATALTLTNISTGIGGGMIGFSAALTTAAVFACSLLAVSAGVRLGHYSGAVTIKGFSGTASGLLLVFIGLYEMLG